MNVLCFFFEIFVAQCVVLIRKSYIFAASKEKKESEWL